MVKSHSYSIFGQSAGMLINSKADDLSWFVRFIKKKPDGSWEKPSQGEGKVIKFSLDETVMILRVLNGLHDKWTTVHDFKSQKTQISFSKDENGVFWINAGDYAKTLNFAQVEVLRNLVIHFFHEKIECATVPTIQEQKEDTEKQIEEALTQDSKEHEKKNNPKPKAKSKPKPKKAPQNKPKDLTTQIIKGTGLSKAQVEELILAKEVEFKGLISTESAMNLVAKELGIIERIEPEEVEDDPQQISNPFQDEEHATTIPAILKGETLKAFLINTKNIAGEDIEIWIPKSQLKNKVQFEENKETELVVINWILRKHNIIVQKEG